MGEDEAATVQTLTLYRTVIQTWCKNTEVALSIARDNVLAEFPASWMPCSCAVAFQK